MEHIGTSLGRSTSHVCIGTENDQFLERRIKSNHETSKSNLAHRHLTSAGRGGCGKNQEVRTAHPEDRLGGIHPQLVVGEKVGWRNGYTQARESYSKASAAELLHYQSC